MKENNKPIEEQTLVERLRIRASIRRNNTERKSVQEGKPDRIADLLEEAANEIETLQQADWISVNDVLPERYRECLVYPWISDYILTAELQQDGWNYTVYITGYGAEVNRLPDGRITHWKYLEGPKV